MSSLIKTSFNSLFLHGLLTNFLESEIYFIPLTKTNTEIVILYLYNQNEKLMKTFNVEILLVEI